MVPTNTSRAAKEVNKAIPIFQLKPSGLMTGSMTLPTDQRTMFHNCAVSVGSNTLAVLGFGP